MLLFQSIKTFSQVAGKPNKNANCIQCSPVVLQQAVISDIHITQYKCIKRVIVYKKSSKVLNFSPKKFTYVSPERTYYWPGRRARVPSLDGLRKHCRGARAASALTTPTR